MAARKNGTENVKKPGAFVYYAVYLDDDDGKPIMPGSNFASKGALFEACTKWLDEGRCLSIYPERVEFFD